jgi:multimeric flavodoxin WrbA
MKIRILGLNCSPRNSSNSGAVLDYAFKQCEGVLPSFEWEIVNLRDIKIEPCKDCDVCGKTKDSGEFIDCIQARKDDVQAVLDKMVEADALAIATPVYFGLASDLFSKFIMRTRVLRHQDFRLSNKPVAVFATAGRRSGGGETAIISTWLPFVRHGCLVVGNGDKTSQFGAIGWAGPRGDIMNDEWGLEQGVDTVKRLYEVASLVKAGAETLSAKRPMKFCYKSGCRVKH